MFYGMMITMEITVAVFVVPILNIRKDWSIKRVSKEA